MLISNVYSSSEITEFTDITFCDQTLHGTLNPGKIIWFRFYVDTNLLMPIDVDGSIDIILNGMFIRF